MAPAEPSSAKDRRGRVQVWPEAFARSWEPEPERWLLVRSQPRHEKKLADDMERRNVAGCLFLEKRLRDDDA